MVGCWAPWCVPSGTLEAAFASALPRYAGRLRLTLVDLDANPRVVERHGIAGLPTILAFRNGQETARRVGLMSREGLLRFLDLHALG